MLVRYAGIRLSGTFSAQTKRGVRNMTISSRTPEGQPNHCPICGADVCIEPSPLFGDATCPQCGSLLWFLNVESRSYLFERTRAEEIRERVIAMLAERLGVEPRKITDGTSLVDELDADSLDVVELVMEFEEDLGLQEPPGA
jgi:acyl carrier protein